MAVIFAPGAGGRKIAAPITIGSKDSAGAWLEEGTFTPTGDPAIRLSWRGRGDRALILAADDLRELVKRATEAGIL
jgi:hypothetical protein